MKAVPKRHLCLAYRRIALRTCPVPLQDFAKAPSHKVEDREEPGNDGENTLNGEMNMSAVKLSGSAISVGVSVGLAVCEADGPQASWALP
ncbi:MULTISPECIES: hypothetical protein [Methylococcus]|uniref:hypothetical protein n=1 Tax=Methylococcus TaxID=413 RepID=UPI001C530BE7|nr:hypothetical protein [Methylococcus capsulatus]QXP91912.1 hypothetical protein KW114_07215 [Methylococcus capsulatus]